MTISYPLSLPTSIGIERFQLSTMNAVSMLRSPFSFATQVQQHAGQIWGAEVDVAVTTDRSKAEPWEAFLAQLMGTYGTFLMGHPRRKTPLGLATGTPKVNGSVSARSQTISTKGWTTNATDILKAGDFIQIGQRLYKVLNDHNTNGSGETTIDVFPNVREALADNTTIITTNTVGLFRLASSQVNLGEVDKETVIAISFSAVEAI